VTFTPWRPLSLIPGVRADHYSEIGESTVDPRLSARYRVTDSTTLKAGVGRFSQPPELGAAIEGIGNAELDPIHALHVGAGVEQEIGTALQVDVEGFYKRIDDMVVNTEDGGPPFLVNEGQGRIVGVELAVELDADDVFGQLAYTLSRSERRLHEGEYLLFDYDQPHILTASAGYRLGRGWLLSSTLRVVSGNPETPITGAVANVDEDVYLPIFGRTNSTRAALFHRLDLRVEKRWTSENGNITLYLDVQNVLNQRHPEATVYSYDYRVTDQVLGLPILPILGVKGEL